MPDNVDSGDASRSAETPRQKIAYEARKGDMQAANDGARAATQVAVLINGGAATAILSFLSTYLTKSSTVPPAVLYAAALSLFGYATAVGFAAWSMWCASQAAGQYGLRWETYLDLDYGETERNAAEKQYLEEGDKWVRKHRAGFGISIALFLISSLAMAFGFFLSVK
jgi:hypothetical protein